MRNITTRSSLPLSSHRGYSRIFAPTALTLGFILPLESYPDGPIPTMADHVATTRLADKLGFGALWARDVPTFDPSFGDVGQIFDPFTYLGFLASNTKNISLGTGSAVITLRHPIHVAKSAASIDHLSEGRLLLGISSGDRPVEYPAFGLEDDYESRGERFREAYQMITQATEAVFPRGDFPRFGRLNGHVDTIPKPVTSRMPMLVTGRSRQDLDWIASNADGWLYYYLSIPQVARVAEMWREAVRRCRGEDAFSPFMQALFLDVDENPNAPIRPIHSGFSAGRKALNDYLFKTREAGVNHVAFNTKPSRRPLTEVLHELAEFVLPNFPSLNGNRLEEV